MAVLKVTTASGSPLGASGLQDPTITMVVCTSLLYCSWRSTYSILPAAQMVKNLPARQETRVPTLGWEVPLEKRMAMHSSIPAWRIPWTEKPGGL